MTSTSTRKIKVEDIVLSQEQKESLNELNNRISTAAYLRARKGIIGVSDCCICGQLSTKKITIDVSENDLIATRIETYCDKCFTRWEKHQKMGGMEQTYDDLLEVFRPRRI